MENNAISNPEDKSDTTVPKSYTTNFVTSKDGTTIGYRQLGRGPGVVVLHGTAESAQSHMQLAEIMSDSYTVYLPDRRGRGISGSYGKDDIVKESVEDLEAILARTGAHYVFGVSAGGIVYLKAAYILPAIQKVAIYEPPLFADLSKPAAILSRFDREMAQGEVVSAMITAMKGSQMGPPIFKSMPRWLLKPLMTRAMKSSMTRKEVNKKTEEDVTIAELTPTLHYDFVIIVETSGNMEAFKAIQTDVLLLGGSKCPAYLKRALDSLEKTIPHVTTVEFPGLSHNGSGNADQGGKPELVAQQLSRFFTIAQNQEKFK